MQPRIPRPSVIAMVVVAMVLLSLCGLLVTALWEELAVRRDPGRTAVAVLGTLPFLILYGRLLWLNLMRRTTARHRLGLAATGVICCLLPAVLGPGWGVALVLPAGLIAVVLPVRQAVLVTALGTLGITAYGLLLQLGVLNVLFQMAWFPVAAFSGYATIWVFHVVQELREARAELARAAVGEERQRFARDLHDVLGHSLQALALRAEVAERFLDRDPGRVRKELTEIQRMARASVQDVREVVRGYRATSLRSELDGVSAVLSAAGIRCAAPDLPGDLPAHVHEPLGWVAREAVTNVLRHSSASWCEIAVRADPDRVRLEIVNDGAGRRGGDPGLGSGLAGLAERMAAAGGGLTAGPAGEGRFRVAASVPVRPAGDQDEGAR